MTWHPLGARVGSTDEGMANSSKGLLRERERERESKCKRMEGAVTN